MTAFAKLTLVEAKLFRRNPTAMFWGLIFPALLLVALGALFPGFQEPSEDLGGQRAIDLYAPIAIGMGLATLGLGAVPVYLATYRERGVLRRLSTTPVPPLRLLSAVLTVQLVAAAAAAVLAVGVAVVGFDVPLPRHPLPFALAFVLAAASLYAMGLVVGSVAKGASAAQSIGWIVYFPMLLFAGVYFPREVMPDGLRTASDLSPAGAAVAALEDAWLGTGPAASSLIVMAAFAIGAGLLAAKVFRWQ
jgi:ABC-2 type transport system permease protein